MSTWASLMDVQNIAMCSTATDEDLMTAQALIEARANRLFDSTDLGTDDGEWLKRAVAFQTAYLVANPQVLVMMDVKSSSGVAFRDNVENSLIAPAARLALKRLRSMSGTLTFSSPVSRRRTRGFTRGL